MIDCTCDGQLPKPQTSDADATGNWQLTQPRFRFRLGDVTVPVACYKEERVVQPKGARYMWHLNEMPECDDDCTTSHPRPLSISTVLFLAWLLMDFRNQLSMWLFIVFLRTAKCHRLCGDSINQSPSNYK